MRKQAKIFLTFLLASLCFSAVASPPEHHYPKLEGIPVIHNVSWDREYTHGDREYDVDLSFFVERGDKYYGDIEKRVDSGTKATFEFAALKDLPMKECRDKGELDIFAVSMDTLNNKERFSEWQNINGKAKAIVALYDPVFSVNDYAVIVLADHREETVAHEVAHYWFDRLCWDMVWDGSTEHFAQALEKYYVQNKM